MGISAPFAGPFLEAVGRNPLYIVMLFLYMVFVMASGLANNIGSQLVFRFLADVFASTPTTTAAGSAFDLWSPLEMIVVLPLL